jgi:hypothetical protein
MYSVDMVERLILIRLESPLDATQIARFVERCRTLLLGAAAGLKVVTIADLRGAKVMAPDVADMLIPMFVRSNAAINRTAILVSHARSSLGMQFGRLLQSAKNPARRLFDDPGEAVAYLGEVLEAHELLVLERFLATPDANPTGS